jgi:ATP-dependent helicase/nuclease subunit A
MTRPADWRVRELGRDLHNSYIVQAPAGSGKTELLTQRMLGLLAHVENPEEVVAITFTRKAAAEMRNRLLGRLQDAAINLPEGEVLPEHEQISRQLALDVLENDAQQGWNLLEQPSRLRVRTIDSLCSELGRQLPVLSGLGGGQQIAVDADALYRLAAARTMAAIEETSDPLREDVIRVLDRYDNKYDNLVGLLTSMLASREQWLGHILDSRRGNGFDRKGLENALRFLVERELQTARQLTPDELLTDLPRFYNYAISNDAQNAVALEESLQACGGPNGDFLDLPTTAEALPYWKTMIAGLLTLAGTMRKAPTAKDGFPAPSGAKGEEKATRDEFKKGYIALLAEHAGNTRLLESYRVITKLPNPQYEDEAWESLESLMRILLRTAENWNVVMAETGEVDFGEIASRAIESLGHDDAPSDLALRMDYRIQHLLVDEFQDTSASQIRLLNQLTTGWSDGDGRSLFLVGDPMQSIYRFRKAEVSLFITAWEGELFDHILLNPLQLAVNFRSNRPIVDWVNQTFPIVMPFKSDPIMGAVSYSEASTKPEVLDDGTVAVQILPDRDDEEEARLVVDVIGNCNADETIAILVRSRGHASAILAELDRKKLNDPRYRYQAMNFTPLAETVVIQDLVSLTLALTQPADRLAWLATLRSPFIGLDLADLDQLVAGNSGNIILETIGENINPDGQNILSREGQSRLARTGPLLLHAMNRRGRQSVRSLVETTWIALGGPACVGNDSELDDASTFFSMLDALENENQPIDRDTLELRMENLYAEPDSGADGNLQVITIYAAKGLQFDTVILPGLNRQTRGEDAKLLHWFELAEQDRIVMSPMRNTEEKESYKKGGDLITYITSIEKQRKSLEDGRLLYVAATRAIHSLYLFAAIKPGKDDVVKARAASLLGSLWPAIEIEQTEKILAAAESNQPPDDEGSEDDFAETDVAGRNLPQIYRRLGVDWQPPTAPESVSQDTAQTAEAQSYIEFSWAGEDARLVGNLVHRLLQLIGEQGLDSWQASGGMSTRQNWCRQQLASLGIKNSKADTIIKIASEAIAKCLSSEKGNWILGSHEEAQCEYAITAILDKRPRSMVLDRTFIADGTRWIIDYKTSSHRGGDLEGFLKNEEKRYQEQLLRYKNAMAITESRPIKTALYFPLLDQLLEVDTGV